MGLSRVANVITAAAGDDKPHGYRDQPETHDPLPWRGAELIP